MEKGITLPRLYELAELYSYHQALELYQLGATVASAFHKPENLSQIDPDRQKQMVNPEMGPLRIPQRKG